MAERDRGVSLLAGEKNGDGLADDIRAADNDGVLALYVHAGKFNEFNDAVRSAGQETVVTYEHPSHIEAIASISKQLASLNGLWGLAKWPTVNPKNIRDKIFVVLESKKEPMHFADIAEAIAESDFKRKNVTIQAIHNELIKDSRFVLIGRGIYALDSWGYKKGTVSDIITQILKEAGKPLTRVEIVKQVLRSRKVKETTILLNLQNKKLFKKVDKNSYTVADQEA